MAPFHFELASRYFSYLSERFPVMCASDEFHFMPQATEAALYYDRLDSLSANRIGACMQALKQYRREFERLLASETDLENRIDLQLLIANITGILIEFEVSKSWQHNPLLYLKIAFIGLDQALTKPETASGEKIKRAAARLGQIPRLIGEAVGNLANIPETYYRAARAMLGDCKSYLKEAGNASRGRCSDRLSKGLQQVGPALDKFEKFLEGIAPLPDEKLAPASVETTLSKHFLSLHDLKDIFQIAVAEWRDNLQQLKTLQKKINARKSWQELYHGYSPSAVQEMGTLSLYRQEAQELRLFFKQNGFMDDYLDAPVALAETPTYLHSVRSSASFAAAFTDHREELSYFYITTRQPAGRDKKAGGMLKKRLHREYKFLTAHETIPGHQLLDTVRRRLKNPVRRQIESPLFYEGWATYAETLLTELGYIRHPLDRLVDFKRRLWRAARGQIDAGLHGGFLKFEEAVGLLTLNGFSVDEARHQIARFRLNPGYQLCYSYGCHEIKKLVNTYKNRLGLDRVHRLILEGGELPFHLIDKELKLSAASCGETRTVRSGV